MADFQYTPPTGWNDETEFPDYPTAPEVRPMFQKLFDQIRDAFNAHKADNVQVSNTGQTEPPHGLPKCKYDATVAPTADNDVSEGYSVGSKWIDITHVAIHECVDATEGAAVWKNLSASVSAVFKVGSFTRDATLASGTQAITGVGFKPSAVILLGITGAVGEMSIALATTSGIVGIYDAYNLTANTWSQHAGLRFSQSSQIGYVGTIRSYDSDGFTMDWVKVDSKTGMVYVQYLAIK